jgi:ketosteroid isomerase-like protein
VMSQATVELMQRFFDAFDRHDESALLDLVHPDVEFTSVIAEVEGGFRGHEGVRLYLSALFETFPDFRVAVDEIRPIGDGAVVKVRGSGSGATSGAATDLTNWQAVKLRDGKAIWWAFFRIESDAIQALSEQR